MCILRSLVVLSLLLPSATLHAGEFEDIVFVGGQSNAKPQLADGVESALARADAFENLRVVVTRHGGTPIRFWLDEDLPTDHRRHPAQQKLKAPNWYEVDFKKSPGTPGPAAFLEKVFEEVEAAGRTPRLVGLVWFHGESDSENDGQVEVYRDRVEGLRGRLADDFHGGQPVPTVLVQVAVNEKYVPETFGTKDPERAGRIDRLRTIQAELAASSPTVAVVDSKPFERIDVWHVDWKSEPVSVLEELGIACGEALLELHGR